MEPFDLVGLTPFMQRLDGHEGVSVGIIDGPVMAPHPYLPAERVRLLSSAPLAESANRSSSLEHGTFVAGLLAAAKSSPAPGICPGCSLLAYAIFGDAAGGIATATSTQLAAAIVACVEAGARCLNLSLSFARLSSRPEPELSQALSFAEARGVLVVAAAGNQAELGSNALTRHPWVIPVVGCSSQGRPSHDSNLGNTVGRRGLLAPGENIPGLGLDASLVTRAGSSVAAPFVTGTIALMWSAFPAVSAAQMKLAITRELGGRRRSVVPPLLDAGATYDLLKRMQPFRKQPRARARPATAN